MAFLFTVYDKATGELLAQMDMPDIETALLNVDHATEGMIDGHWNLTRYYRRHDGVMTLYPQKPDNPYILFNYDTGVWYDPRTEQEKDQQALDAIINARRASWLPKAEFLLRCMEFGIIDPDEAAQASIGVIPDPFQDAYNAMTPMEKAYLIVIWPSATKIERLDPFILKIAEKKGYPDELLDMLFKVQT